jgi:hypothetical protein
MAGVRAVDRDVQRRCRGAAVLEQLEHAPLPQVEVGEAPGDAADAEDRVDLRPDQGAAVAHRDAEHAVVEGERALEVGAGDGDVVEPADRHGSSRASRSSCVSARRTTRAPAPLSTVAAAAAR